MHISDFGGHKLASQNIKDALKLVDPYVNVLNINGFGYLYPRSEKLVNFLYSVTIKRFPHLWGKMYDKKKVIKAFTPLKRIANILGFYKFSRLLKRLNPDCIIATQAFPCGIASDFKKVFNLKIPIFAVVTDYHPHRFWLNHSVDTYIVACPQAKATLINEGVSAKRIKILGIPISIRFLETYSRQDISSRYGFDPELSTILIMGGGGGLGPIKDTFLELNKIKNNFQIIVVCGRNKSLYRWFRKRKDGFRRPVFYFGYIGFVNQLMDFSDIIITKAGGLTISEALAKKMAIIVINPIPGQEERNVSYLKIKKTILEAADTREVRYLAEKLLTDKKELIALKKKTEENSIINSSLNIAKFILNY